ncbi:hypothetical protein B0H13DRAFT_2382991 [Mycena leptocephala]|nr:hypothetical protein B0H13DRAFT_2382991 [Mycena leptocephala]
MDSLHFQATFAANNNDDAPRTPSPPTMRYSSSPQNYKAELDPVRIFSADDDQYQWGHHQQPRPSLLQELYEPDGMSPEHASPPDMYVENDWPAPQQQHQGRPQDYTLIRRATFPYARQERPEDLAQYPPFLHHDQGPIALHGDNTYSPPGYAPADFDPAVKVEDHHHHMPAYHPHHAPPQFYRPHPGMHPHAHGMHPHHMHPHAMHGPHGGYAPHGLPVQHTDDAASKETQYLRRRCFNCHTTEPPSWRRSTLNPGKIVCNKCGLYERTHLRARPLRFDELRAGNKARKGAKGVGSPKAGAQGGVGKKGGAIARRSSVSSTGSSAQSGSGASDWDDSGCVSLLQRLRPPTSFNSPAFSPHPPSLSLSSSISASSSSNNSNHGSPGRDSLSRSPPLLNGSISSLSSPPHSAGSFNGQFPSSGGNGIRLPHAPDIPTLSHSHHGHGMRTKPRSNTTGGLGPSLYYSPPAHHGHGHGQQGQGLHHSSSNSSLHSQHSQHSPALSHEAGQQGGQAQWDEMGVSVKEEPRAVLV